MNETESETRYLLAAGTEDRPRGIDLLDGFTAARCRARRTRTRVIWSAGVTTAVAAASAVALTVSSASAAPPALAAVTSALTRTLAQSYHTAAKFHSHADTADAAQNGGGWDHYITCRADTDSARNLYTRTCSDGDDERRVGGEIYYGMPPTPDSTAIVWAFGPPKGPPIGELFYGFGSDTPQQLLTKIEQASKVSEAGPASGPGWTGTKYTFTENTPPGWATISGIVEVDQQGRARVLDLTTTTAKTDLGSVVTEDFTFSDFGESVTVTPPPVGPNAP